MAQEVLKIRNEATGEEYELGGSGGYKLINTITTEEEIASLYVNTDSNGNPFECDDMLIISECDTSYSTTIFWRFGNGIIGDSAQFNYHLAVNSVNVNYYKMAYMLCEKLCTNMYRTESIINGAKILSNIKASDNISNNGLTEPTSKLFTEDDKIREVKIFYTGTTTTIPANTKFRIYGR